MRVLFISRKWPPARGGMELYSVELTAALNGLDGVQVDTFVLPGRACGGAPGPGGLAVFALRAVARVLARGRDYDVIHVGDFVLWPLLVWSRLVAPRARRVVTVHGLDLIFACRPGLLPRVYRGYLWCARRCGAVLDGVVANSRATAELAEGAGFHGARAIPLGARVSQTPERPIASDARYLLYVGRLVERKGAAWFAETVLPYLPSDVRLKVVGPAWDERELRRLEAAPRVELLGHVDDRRLAELRSGAAAVVMPNIPTARADIEGFGLTAVEAPAQGALLVASRYQGIECAVVDGETGFLVAPGDAAAWIARLEEVLNWDVAHRAWFVERAQERVRQVFSWDRVARETVAVYRVESSAGPASGANL